MQNVKTHRNQIIANSTATKSLLEEPERPSIAVPQRQHWLWGNGSSLLPTQTNETWLRGPAGYLPRAGIPKRFCDDERLALPSNSLSHSVRKLRRSVGARVKQSTPSLQLGVSPTPANVPDAMAMANYHNLPPQPFGQTIGRTNLITELEATRFWCMATRSLTDQQSHLHLLRSTSLAWLSAPRWLEYPIWAWQEPNNEQHQADHELVPGGFRYFHPYCCKSNTLSHKHVLSWYINHP